MKFEFREHVNPIVDFLAVILPNVEENKYDKFITFEFRFGTTNGLFKITDYAVVLVAVVNTSPGNGHVAKLFDELMDLGRLSEKEVFEIIEIHNKPWGRKLLTKGFKSFKYGLYKNI